MLFRRLVATVFLLVSTAVVVVHAQVKATLVSAVTSIQPGQPFTVALHLEHQPHWHTYWLNPGTGLTTTLTWTLPEGWKAGDIQWPTPIVIKDAKGNITGNGYTDDTLLPLTLTPPATLKAGETVALKAKAEWLMCADVCVPGSGEVQLTLPVADTAPTPSPWSAKIAALPMPKPLSDWKASAHREGKNVVLQLASAHGGAGPELNDPHFFADDGFIQYDQPQTARRVADGYEFILPISESAEPATTRLIGVISTQNPLTGWRVDVPLTAGGAPGGTNASATANTAAATPAAAGGLGGTLALAFIGGLILNLMPCVFPVLGIKILGFVNQSGADRRKVTLHGLAFAAGILLSFWTLAGALAALRAGGEQLGWGFQLQSPVFIFSLALVMLIFALSLSGVFEFGLSATAVGGSLQAKSGYAGSFFTGVLATVVATPCSAPFLAPALGAALALSLAQSFIVFTAIALGLALPYLLLSIFPQAVKLLPRPGAWMETFKQIMAFPLYATVAYLIWVLAGQVTEYGLLFALFGLVLAAMAAWTYGRWATFSASARQRGIATFAAFALLAVGVATGYPRAEKPGGIVWEKWSPEAVAALRAQGRTIYVDFTARWCATCQANKAAVFSSSDVLSTFQKKNVATLKADWTNKDPHITAELAKFSRSAVPFNLVFKPGEPEPITLPELLTPKIVLEAVQ